jgi:hypothetical protein
MPPPKALYLRQMRVHLDDPVLLASLHDFLREHDCVVEQIDRAVLAVWCPPADHDGGASGMICRSCGATVADTLGRLGSIRCHDCRDESRHETLLAGVYGHTNGNGHAANARVALAGYLAAWSAANPGAEASLID